MRTQGSRRSSRRGSALIAALLVVVAVATLGLVWLELALSRNREQIVAVDSKRAFYMAEAGLSEGFLGLVTGMSGNVGSEVLPARFANGLFWTSCVDEGEGRYTIKSTGLCGAGRASLAMSVEKQSSSVATLGVFADRGLVAEAGSFIDSFDSRDGPYTPAMLAIGAPLPTGARCGSNGDVALHGGASAVKVYGDVRPGPGMTLLRGSGVVVSGATAPSETTSTLPAIDVPVIASSGARATSARAPSITLGAGQHAYDALHVGGRHSLHVDGPAEIVIGALQVDAGGSVTIDASGGPVKIYVTSSIELAAGSTFSTASTLPGAVALLVSASELVDRDGDGTPDEPVSIDASGEYYGTVYAPSANVSTSPTLAIHGAIAARTLTLRAGTQFHFDRALLEPALDEASLPAFLGWRIVELPSVKVVSLHYDPLYVLRRAGLTPPLARDAHLAIGATQDTDAVRRRGGRGF